MTAAFKIRPERDEDHAAVRDVHRRAFGEQIVATLADTLRAAPAPLSPLGLVAEAPADADGSGDGRGGGSGDGRGGGSGDGRGGGSGDGRGGSEGDGRGGGNGIGRGDGAGSGNGRGGGAGSGNGRGGGSDGRSGSEGDGRGGSGGSGTGRGSGSDVRGGSDGDGRGGGDRSGVGRSSSNGYGRGSRGAGRSSSSSSSSSSHIIGHVLLSASRLDAPTRILDVLVLSPLGVLPEHQRQGVGTQLIRAALATAEARDVPLVFLEGSPTYYASRGFTRADALGFRSPSLRIPPPAFQVATLSTYQPWMTGTLVYSDPFWALDCVGLR